jgi:hypothetical protein
LSSAARAEEWGDKPMVELDSIEPKRLRQLVRACIAEHMPDDRYQELMAEEEAERATLAKLIKRLR